MELSLNISMMARVILQNRAFFFQTMEKIGTQCGKKVKMNVMIFFFCKNVYSFMHYASKIIRFNSKLNFYLVGVASDFTYDIGI